MITYVLSLCTRNKNLTQLNLIIMENKRKNHIYHNIFNKYNKENDFTRYLYRLTNKDYTLTDGMIPLGSCTMKLNASFN